MHQDIHSYNTKLLELEAEQILLSQEKDNLEIQLKILESNDREPDEIFQFLREQDILASKLVLEFMMNQNPTSTQLIGEIVTRPIDPKKELYILLSFLSGLFLSFVIVFINVNLIKLKENKS